MRAITVMGMSGVGKTTLSVNADKSQWFHYSVDYRIGTRYLGEEISDSLIACAMRHPTLADLLRSDSIYIRSNLSFENLNPLSRWVGKIGDPKKGGLPLDEFKRRQALHREAEIRALLDAERFMHRAAELYGYDNFLIDAGGSIIEVVDVDNPADDPVLQMLSRISKGLYIEATADLMSALVERSVQQPKPMYYTPQFLDEQLDAYQSQSGITDVNSMDPDGFVRFVIPQLTHYRAAKYLKLIKYFGRAVSSDTTKTIDTSAKFEALLETL